MRSPTKKTVIIICGPTAAGKTAVAIQLAKHFQTEIISADSRQCFKELNLGVARPSAEELKTVKHYFVASHTIHQEVTAVVFEQYALQKTKELFQQHDKVIMTGGTGLYIKAFCEGLDAIPAVPATIRENITRQYASKGLQWLQDEIKEKDPSYYSGGEIRNPQRLMRALEVVEATGQSILSFRNRKKTSRDFDIVKIGLELPKEELVRNINARVDKMMQAGLLYEVKGLYPYKGLNALRTVGYAELIEHLEGKLSLQGAVERIKTNTRLYAKRQMTWFRNDKTIKWFSPARLKPMIEYVEVLGA
jgi:tRNA dimethylallyltransferase